MAIHVDPNKYPSRLCFSQECPVIYRNFSGIIFLTISGPFLTIPDHNTVRPADTSCSDYLSADVRQMLYGLPSVSDLFSICGLYFSTEDTDKHGAQHYYNARINVNSMVFIFITCKYRHYQAENCLISHLFEP